MYSFNIFPKYLSAYWEAAVYIVFIQSGDAKRYGHISKSVIK